MKTINIIVLDESIFKTNKKDLISFGETSNNSFLNFKKWFLREKFKKQQHIFFTILVNERIHPNQIETFVKLYFKKVKATEEEEFYIITMNPDILQYFSSLSKKYDKIKVKYYIALKKPTQNEYVLEDKTEDTEEIYRVLVDKTNNDFFREQEKSVFGEQIKEILLKIIKKKYQADEQKVIAYVGDGDNIIYCHFTVRDEPDKDPTDIYGIFDIKCKCKIEGTQDQQAYLEKLKNDEDI